MRKAGKCEPRSGRFKERGQAILEFVLATGFLMILIMAIFELFGLLYTYNVLADAAKEGVRYAIVHGSNNSSSSGPSNAPFTPPCASSNNNNGSAANVLTQVRNFAGLSLHDVSNMNVSVCYLDGNNNASSRVQVSLNYPFRPFFGLGWPSVTVNANSEGRIVY